MNRPGGEDADRVQLAQAAFEVGLAAASALERIRWLDRAHRVLPGDDTLRLALAQALLGHDNPRAERLLLDVLARHDVREAWLALAAARHKAADMAGAAEALRQSLRHHAFPPRLAPLADVVARDVGAPGWCGLAEDGGILAGPHGLAPRSRALPDRLIRVESGGVPLLGSPLDPSLLTRTEGFVEHDASCGLQGWAWLPSNPDRHPRLVLRDAAGRGREIRAEDWTGDAGGGLLARRRTFRVPAQEIGGLARPLRLLGEDGRDLLGSPLPHALHAPRAIKTGSSRPARPGKVAVVVPVHGGGRVALDCIASVRATLPEFATLIVVDDGAPEPRLSRRLDALAAAGKIRLIRLAASAGFPAAANAGLEVACNDGADAILLNSDTLVAGSWVEDLRSVAYAAPDIGTVTPLSNGGGILSYPHADRANDAPDRAATKRLFQAVRAANAGRWIEIPVGIGFCLYIRRDCLRQTGLLRIDLFSQGYGEENDFCLRAAARGFRHVAATGVFVTHLGGVSMGTAAEDLRRRNSGILERLHPGYHARIAGWLRADPVFSHRREIDLRRCTPLFRAGRTVAIVIHDQGGGVERAVRAEVEALARTDQRAVILRPARLAKSRRGVRVEVPGLDCPNLCFALPQELPNLLELLRLWGVQRIAFHHLLGHAQAIRKIPGHLGVPHEVYVHDYAWLCPRVVLLGPDGSYCGEPDLAGCAACIARAGSFTEGVTDAGALRQLSARLLAEAERVMTPSADAAMRLRRYFPAIAPRVVAPDAVGGPAARKGGASSRKIAVIGAIGPAKGYDVLLAMAGDAARRRLPLSFVLVGHSTGDEALLRTGRVFITGPFAPEEAENLIRAQSADLALIPSVVPETWCYALSEAWKAGLAVAAFDLGAQAERIRASETGLLLPRNCGAAAANDALLAACDGFRHEQAPQESRTGR